MRRGRALPTLGALTLTAALLAGCDGGTPAAVDTARAPGPAPASTSPAAVRASPASIRIPAIAVSAPVGFLGFDEAARTVEVPRKPMETGWYRYGSSPGEDGAAVILGHVDSRTGPAVFARLKELRAGDKITVMMSDRSGVRYVVKEVATYPNAKFPAQRVYGGAGASTLNLVTCGGAYNRKAGGYQSNVVVYTSLAEARAGGPGTHHPGPGRRSLDHQG